nr:unnamed protein product [Digitaria exilis]
MQLAKASRTNTNKQGSSLSAGASTRRDNNSSKSKGAVKKGEAPLNPHASSHLETQKSRRTQQGTAQAKQASRSMSHL